VKTVTLPLYVTKHKAMKMYGRMEVWLHALTSAIFGGQ
jgi:hypothetical protein